MSFPILSIITFLPLVAGMLLLFMPPERKTAIRLVALGAAVIDLLLSAWVYLCY